MKIIIFTGNELRHKFFRQVIASNDKISVLKSYCENDSDSLSKRTLENKYSSELEISHVKEREKSENFYFSKLNNSIRDLSNSIIIPKGSINDNKIVKEVKNLNPDLIICYGSSLIKSELIDWFSKKFLNVHLGLSPYYRGSGTNVWPIINNELEMVGVTYMYIDQGIDTGEIIHQIRGEFHEDDTPHDIGNRLIIKMTTVIQDIIINFEKLSSEMQPASESKFYKRKDFNEVACRRLYENCNDKLIKQHNKKNTEDFPYIVNNKIFSKS